MSSQATSRSLHPRRARRWPGHGVFPPFREMWASPLSRSSTPFEHGKVKALYVMGENPMLSDPDLHHVEKGLKGLDFLVVPGYLPHGDRCPCGCGPAPPPVLPRRTAPSRTRIAAFNACARRRTARRGKSRLANPLRDRHEDGLSDEVPQRGGRFQ